MNILVGFILVEIGMFIGVFIMCLLQINREKEEIIETLTVRKWISYELAKQEIEIGELIENKIGGMGGWFNLNGEGHRWKDYAKKFTKHQQPYIEALRKEIISNNIKIAGSEHQERKDGVPVFSDNTVALYSYRGWGDLMAAIWSTEENKDYSYIDFYMRIKEEE